MIVIFDDTDHSQDVIIVNDDDTNDEYNDKNDERNRNDSNNNDCVVAYTYHLFLNDKIAASVPLCIRLPVIVYQMITVNKRPIYNNQNH